MPLKAAFFFAAVIAFTWIGYPALAYLFSKMLPRPVRKAAFRPRVSIVLPVYNEGPRVEGKIRNILAQEYPRELLEIIVVDDGSTDRSIESLPASLAGEVCLIALPWRCGKAAALNCGIRAATGKIIVFMDARQQVQPGSLSALLDNFNDRRVTAVTGALQACAKGGESLFRRYEEALRAWESAWSSPAGATGALYAVRRASAPYLEEMTILDDLVISMTAASRGRLVYEPRAVAIEPQGQGASRRRRLRTLAGNWQILLHPLRYRGIYSAQTVFQLCCHKFLRLTTPFCAGGLILSLSVAAPAITAAGLATLVMAPALALATPGCTGRGARRLAWSLLVAPLRSLARYLSRSESVLWQRTQ